MKLYLNEKPRAFLITSNSHALIIRHPYPKYKEYSHSSNVNNLSNNNKVIVEFLRKDNINLLKYKDITPKLRLTGFLGLLNYKQNIYLGFITREKLVASPIDSESINKILEVDFFCLNNDEFDDFEIYSQIIDSKESRDSKPAGSVRKLLADGTFYYSQDFDITSNIQSRGLNNDRFINLKNEFKDSGNDVFMESGGLASDKTKDPFQTSSYNKQFMWNNFMISEFIEFRNRLPFLEQIQFDKSGFLVTIIRGYTQSVNTSCAGEPGLLTLITRQACDKMGPIFGNWGCDDNGAVANYAETEVILATSKFILSYIIIRGNVPIYWEIETSSMKRNLITTQKIKKLDLSRSFDASHHAFSRHFDNLIKQYGEIQIINTLPSSSTKDYKSNLNIEFKKHISKFNSSRDTFNSSTVDFSQALDLPTSMDNELGLTDIPISHATLRKFGYTGTSVKSILPLINPTIIDFGALFYDIEKKTYIGKQLGVFRAASFNSSSKTNFISKIISQQVLEFAFRDYGLEVDSELLSKHASLWAENNHYINKIVSHFSSSSDKLKSSSNANKDGKSHFSKLYLQGVVEKKPRELSMLKLLGRLQDQVSVTLHNPIHDYINRELNRRMPEFCSLKTISLFASTFNVNGHCYKDSIKNWLFPPAHTTDKTYDLVFIGIQEIVELKPNKMVNTDLSNRFFWEKKINACLNNHNPEGVTYVSLWSDSIGGIALFLFIKSSEVINITNVEGSVKKTGMGGISANKGGIGVSFNYSKTEICFISSHLAAGMSNTTERHHNYKTIAQGLKFSRNRRIKNHDVVVWLGDFNYRIGLTNEQVKPLIDKKDFPKLFEYDQLNIEMANGETFPFFDELEIHFPPTYKFDNGTIIYDTSEKQRIPAWTDRIISLSREKIIKQIVYDSAEDIIFSDHRPVYSKFDISVNIVNEQQKKNISTELYESYRKKVGDINEILSNNNIMFLFEEDKVLPPPSSDMNKWWLEGSKLAKVTIPEFKSTDSIDGDILIFNPKSPVNPFDKTQESEFISKEQLLRSLTDSKSLTSAELSLQYSYEA